MPPSGSTPPLGQWIADNAPAYVTRQLADAYLRPLDTSSAEQSRPGADDDVKTLLAAQRRREAWVMITAPRSRPGPGWTRTSGVTSTGSAKPPPTANRTT